MLPFPLVCIAAFHASLLNLAAVRARSILTLERELVSAAAVPGVDMNTIGVTASELATNVHTAPRAQRFATIIAYGGVGLIYLAYIALMLVKAARIFRTGPQYRSWPTSRCLFRSRSRGTRARHCSTFARLRMRETRLTTSVRS